MVWLCTSLFFGSRFVPKNDAISPWSTNQGNPRSWRTGSTAWRRMFRRGGAGCTHRHLVPSKGRRFCHGTGRESWWRWTPRWTARCYVCLNFCKHNHFYRTHVRWKTFLIAKRLKLWNEMRNKNVPYTPAFVNENLHPLDNTIKGGTTLSFAV